MHAAILFLRIEIYIMCDLMIYIQPPTTLGWGVAAKSASLFYFFRIITLYVRCVIFNKALRIQSTKAKPGKMTAHEHYSA